MPPVTGNTIYSLIVILISGIVTVIFLGLLVFVLRSWFNDVKDLLSGVRDDLKTIFDKFDKHQEKQTEWQESTHSMFAKKEDVEKHNKAFEHRLNRTEEAIENVRYSIR